MPLDPLPTVWNVYNLQGSPFWQDTLEGASDSRHPASLFVGRSQELERLRARILGGESSRQAVAGVPGVGKTTLVQVLKARLIADAYLTTDRVVPFILKDTVEGLFGRVLGALYDTLLTNRPQCGGNPAMQAAQLLVRADRLPTGGGGFSAAGFGATATRGVTVVTPKDLMIDGPRIMRDLLAMVRGSDARGVVLHLNNLESLSTRDARHAADLLQSLRDPMLMHPGLHYVLVGTADAMLTVLGTHKQVHSVFTSPLVLEPLSLDELHALLDARYQDRRADPARAARSPVAPGAVDALYALYRGDLRGLLKALDDGVEPCIGMRPVPDVDAEISAALAGGVDSPRAVLPVAPVEITELQPYLQRRYGRELDGAADATRREWLQLWADAGPNATYTQKELTATWGTTQATVSRTLTAFQANGYVVALPDTAPTQYALAGTARLVFGVPPLG